MVCLPRMSAAALLVALLALSLLDSASAIVYNYTTFFTPPVGCSLTTGTDGSIYVGLCDQQTILKLTLSNAQLTAASSYNSAVQQTLAPYTSNKNNILQFEFLSISGDGTLWFNDLYNFRILGVDSNTGTSVSTIDMTSYNGALAIGVVNTQTSIWAVVPGASTGTATIVQLSPTGQLLTTISSSNDPTNLPSSYFIFSVQPDGLSTNGNVYVGGCISAVANAIQYLPGSGVDYLTAPGSQQPCDVRKISLATKTVQLPTFTVNQTTLNAANALYVTGNATFIRYISIAPSTATVVAPGSVVGADPDLTTYSYVWSPAGGVSSFAFNGTTNSPVWSSTGAVLNLAAGGTQIAQYNGGGNQNLYTITSVTFGHPYFIAVGPGGSPIYVNSETASTVAVFNTQGTITGYIGSGVLVGPNEMVTDAQGNLYVVDGATNIAYKFSSSGTKLVTFAAPSGMNPGAGAGICVDPATGNVFIPADDLNNPVQGTGYVMIFSSTGQLINTVGQNISYPWACVVTSGSNLIVNSAGEPGGLYYLASNNNYSTPVAVYYPAGGQTWETLGMTQAADGRIFVATLNLGIYIFNSTGQYLDVLSAPAEDIYSYSMAYSTGNGQLYVVDLSNDRVVTFQVGPRPANNAATHSAKQLSAAVMTAAAVVLALLMCF